MELELQVTIDCAEPRRMVAFWAEALGYVPEPPPGGHRILAGLLGRDGRAGGGAARGGR
ncbi:VOC family protein [Micromonospora purpureochromogenes]|uniref:VOC family protein n=1 Tax=Micromonospora purpureochromogenes TaxID=47872 RepID=UPI003625496F